MSMAVEKIAELENIEVPESQIDEQMANLKKEQEKSDDDGPMDEQQMRQKIETTLQSRLVFDFLAEHANLDVVFEEEEFDEDIMNKLAQDSLAREGLDPNQFEDAMNVQDAEVV